MGKAITAIMLTVAQLDNDIKSERTSDGMKAAFNKGHWPWQAPIGYKHVSEPTKKIILLNGFKDLLSQLFEEAASGLYTKTELAKRLNDKGFGRLYGKEASIKTVNKILNKEFYYGMMVSSTWGIQKIGNHKPVTTRQIWLKANQEMMDGNGYTYSSNEEFPLRQFIICCECNNKMTGSRSRGNGGHYFYYRCNKSDCSSNSSIRCDKAHELFTQKLSLYIT